MEIADNEFYVSRNNKSNIRRWVLSCLCFYLCDTCRWAVTFIFAALFGIPAFIIHLRMGDFDIEPVAPGLSMSNLILLILSTIVQVNTQYSIDILW